MAGTFFYVAPGAVRCEIYFGDFQAYFTQLARVKLSKNVSSKHDTSKMNHAVVSYLAHWTVGGMLANFEVQKEKETRKFEEKIKKIKREH